MANNLTEAVAEARQRIGDNIVAAKYYDSDILNRISLGYNRVIQDLNVSMGPHPLTMNVEVSFAAGPREFLLPACIGHILRIDVLAADGSIHGVVPSYHMNYYRGTNFDIRPPFICFDQLLTSALSARITYELRGGLPLHVGTVARSSLTGSSLTLTGAATMGTYDKRPNAFVGMHVRLTACTANPSGIAFFPIQERRVTQYAIATGILTLNLPWDTTLLPVSGTITYEVLMTQDIALLNLAMLEAVRGICVEEQRRARAADMAAEYEIEKINARRLYANMNKVKEPAVPSQMDTINVGLRRPRRF